MKQDEQRRKIIGGIVAARGPNMRKGGKEMLRLVPFEFNLFVQLDYS